MTCDGCLTEQGRCGNPLCNDPPSSRGWDYIYAVAMRSGRLKEVIERYKYGDHKGWAGLFGRVLVGYLEESTRAEDWDLIIPMPTYVGEGGRGWDHIDLIIEHAAIEGPDLPFVRGVVRKTRPNPRLVAQPGFRARAEVAERDFGPALKVVDPTAVAKKSVLVFDDVFTSGLTLREVAHKLKRAGARDVAGVVLACQPFSS
jgi:predicted amidophosphoribosyltransferase